MCNKACVCLGEHVLSCPTQVDRAKHKHMCVAMAPTTAATSEPICCVTMVMVISQKVGESKRWEGGDKNMLLLE